MTALKGHVVCAEFMKSRWIELTAFGRCDAGAPCSDRAARLTIRESRSPSEVGAYTQARHRIDCVWDEGQQAAFEKSLCGLHPLGANA